MTFTIQPGWWLLPLLFTAIALGWAWRTNRSLPVARGDYSFNGVAEAFVLMMALIPCLLAWLIWALLA